MLQAGPEDIWVTVRVASLTIYRRVKLVAEVGVAPTEAGL